MKDRPGKIDSVKGNPLQGYLHSHSANNKEAPCGDTFMAIRTQNKERKETDGSDIADSGFV